MGGLGDSVDVTGQHRSGSVLRVNRVGLAPQPTVTAIRAPDFDDTDT